MNYILLITLIVSAGDGKSWPAAKGRYKYSNMKKKKPPKTPTTLISLDCFKTLIPEVADVGFSLSNPF